MNVLPNIKSAKKRVKVIATKTLQNQIFKSQLRTAIKKFLAAVKRYEKLYQSEFKGIEDSISFKAVPVKCPSKCIDIFDTQDLIDAVVGLPNGIVKMSTTMPGLVQTSTNLARVVSEKGKFNILCLLRSSVRSEKEALAQQKAEGVQRKLVGLKMIDRGIPRHGYKLANLDGEEIGCVTSGTRSPMLKVGIALGYVKTEYAAIGTTVAVVIRDRLLKMEVVKYPFV